MFFKKKRKKIDFLQIYGNIENFVDDIRIVPKKKKKKNLFFRIFKFFFIFFIVIFLLALIISGILFFKFKNIYKEATSGKGSLEYSVEAAKKKDFEGMIESSAEAEKYFGSVLREFEDIRNNFLLKKFNLAQKEIKEIECLAESAGVISKSLNQAAKIAKEMDDVLSGRLGVNFSEFSAEEKERILKLVRESGPELNGAKANLDLALINLDRIQAEGMLSPVREKIKKTKDELSFAVSSISQAILVSQLLPELAGYPNESFFLVMFQNNMELRPTGGFLGTYGILGIKNGDILRFDTHDIYHMDMPMESSDKFQIVPPAPIAKYLNKNWYMRDANWSPDWPTAAKQIEWFYHKENSLLPIENQINDFNGEFSGIIGITPDLVADLLDVIGTIKIENEEFTKDNFVELLQYKVEQDYAKQNISSWERKEIIGDILEEIKIRLFNLDYSQWPKIGKKIEESIEQKNLILFLKDDYLEGLVKDLGVGGEIKKAQGDYLMVVDSNMASLKTDAVMKKSIKYNIEEKAEGLFVKLRINYVHEGGYDWKTSDYKDYVRIYVPEGSKLIKTEGGETEIETKEEFDKTYFGVLFTVKAGRSHSLYFEYKLPEDLKNDLLSGHYRLYVQRQPGNNISQLELDFSGLNEIKSYNPQNSEKLNKNRIKWQSDLKNDKEFEVNF